MGAGAWRGKESGEKWLPRGDHEEGDRLLAFLIACTRSLVLLIWIMELIWQITWVL